ncbi:uncharacterized protein LOC129956842 [Argiope bruennichi]|uniref:uncharacterized protein LOC129956842 n=1 Tax=Argiope bruennichi TaxID=94029 RepID=UPI0024942B1C|nr:uncharacterized protein LOC129956842 [Argiope bruennichi]
MDDPKRYKEHITQIKVARGKVKASLTRLEHSADELESRNEVVIRLQRFRSNMSKQKMGDLPEGRVTLNRPFFVCGIDYAGPISILKHRGRGAKTTKGYMVVFVCFATKALHLELVTDYTSDSFIAALKRFCSRRSTPKHIHSDNGTNFLGAKRKFKDLYNHLSKINLDQNVSYFLSQQEIEWHTIPPLSPHFGGLWEAGVKSVKFHLKRVLGNSNLTFEELYTLLTQIEAILNSRPLVGADNDDVDNLNVLTPSHFIIGDLNRLASQSQRNPYGMGESIMNRTFHSSEPGSPMRKIDEDEEQTRDVGVCSRVTRPLNKSVQSFQRLLSGL